MPRARVTVPSLVLMSMDVGPKAAQRAVEKYLREEGLLEPYREVGPSFAEDGVTFEGELNPCFVVED